MAYSVLAIAPLVTGLAPLATSAELACIGDLPGVQLTQLTGPVTKQRIIDRLGKGSYNAVLWTGHGTPGHLVIEGDTVDPRWLAVQLKQAKISLVVLAACQSGARPAISEFVASFADVLPPAGISAIVMMIDVEDRSAIEYDVALFQALTSGATVRASHETGIEKIAHNPAMAQAPMLIPADAGGNGDFASLQQHVGDLGKALAANDLQAAHKLISETVMALDRIDRRITGIERTVTEHDGRIAAIERHIHPSLTVSILRVVAFFVVLLGIVLAGFQYPVFSIYPFLGLTVEGALIILAGVIILYANAMQERQ